MKGSEFLEYTNVMSRRLKSKRRGMRKMSNKQETKIGDRIKLLHTEDKFTQLKPSDLGTVWDIFTFNIDIDGKPVRVIWISWDSGSKFALIEGKDEFEIIKC
ncbi:MAG: DUF4314 domain-containing protein [Candidatus Nitrosopolaris sp.]